LYYHIGGQKYALGYQGILSNYYKEHNEPPKKFMDTHTCSKTLDFLIHETQLNSLLINFEIFKVNINVHFTEKAYIAD